MVTIDESLNEAATGAKGRWQHPRLLVLLSVLALGLSVNAVVNGGHFDEQGGGAASGSVSGWLQRGVPLFDWAVAPDGGQSVLALDSQTWDRRKVCGRIQHIVETACSLKQYDHDREGIRTCIAQELKYTMWSAYSCN